MQKQTFLEMCIVEELCGPEENDETESDDGDTLDDGDEEIGSDDDAINIKKMMNKSKNKKSIEKSSSNIVNDQDAAVTMLACFSYPPYLRVAEIEAFLELK